MKLPNISVAVRREAFQGNRFDFLIRSIVGDSITVVEPLAFRRVDENLCDSPEPTFSLEPHEAQALLDELYRAGLRPSDGSGSTGQLAATERHLADMRALVFKTPPKP